MLIKRLAVLGLSMVLSLASAVTVFADTTNSITMENSGAYLYEWRPVDCGDGISFAILVGGNTVNESNVILNRGYDYAYTFEPMTYSRPWGTAPDLVNINGIWGIPENWSLLPEGSQPTLQIVLKTNNKNLATDKRYIHVVHLPGNVNPSTLPADVRQYLINVDGSDAGAYDGTVTSGWEKNENGQWTYKRYDGTLITNSWLTVDEKTYYMDENGIMLVDTYAPDGTYMNPSGEKVSYKPGWVSDGNGWRYIQKNGYHAASTWLQDIDGKWYYFNIGAYMAVDTTTPDGFYVDANGVWDGQASTISNNINLGPGKQSASGWEAVDNSWRYKKEDGAYVTNAWIQDNGNWYYFDENSLMVTEQETPDGYYVNADGVWMQ